MGENIKSFERRKADGFFNFCRGQGIDIGCGTEPLILPDPKAATIRAWDRIFGDGDALLMEGVADESFDFVFNSHILEDIPDVCSALRRWWRMVKVGGYLITCVPHRDLYEKKKELPSNWNGAHKHFWLLDRFEPPCTFGLLPIIRQELPQASVVRALVIREGWKSISAETHSAGEYSIEVVLKKDFPLP
jgi:ubiquinone/menaquinone biosynthesis C-methylase UbiE